jgi:RHS repeat-associated protein
MHEHLDEFRLINMNGRIYDPVLGRFLSPDNYIQAPGNPQNYNRYSYTLNNPLKYTDPDGEFVIAAVIIGAAISGTVGYIGGRNAGLRGWDLFGYTFANAMIGGVSGGIGASVGAGVSASLSFGGFAGGFIAGAAGGAAGGFVAGTYTTALNNTTFGTNNNIFLGGLKGAGFGALPGGLIGGTVAGIDAVRSDASFWNGKYVGEVGGGGKWSAEFLDEEIPAGAKPTKTGEIATTESNPDYGKYGWTRNGGTKAHGGVDYVGEVGDDVYSMYGGKVTRMWNSRAYGPNATRISTTLNGKYYNVDYGHLSESVLSLNQSVSAGDLVGYMGRMGNIAGTSFPTHVHIAVWRPLPGNVMGFVQPWWK